MPLTRREVLRFAGIAAGASALSGCSQVARRVSGVPVPVRTWPTGDPVSFSVMRRVTFGPRPEELAQARRVGVGAWLEEQLAPEAISDTGAAWRLRPLDALRLDAADLDAMEAGVVANHLKSGTLIRRIYSRRQVYEMVVAFWTDHFNVSVAKDGVLALKVVDDREVVRAGALGTFPALLEASAHSPAMLVYLDNHVNHRQAPNENYAREVMELHTLGVDGGYTQADVQELAKALTGWTVKKHFPKGRFTFDIADHLPRPKRILGVRVEPGGRREAESVLNRLALHPATAHRIAEKLARRFLADDPAASHAALVDKAARAYLASGGDIRSTLRPILLDGVAAGHLGPKLKTPSDYVVSGLRLLNADTDAGPGVQGWLAQMGQPLFGWPTPDGPPDVAAPWMGGLAVRWRFATALAGNAVGGTKVPLQALVAAADASTSAEVVDRLAVLLLGQRLPLGARRSLVAEVEGQEPGLPQARLAAGALLSAPAFMWR